MIRSGCDNGLLVVVGRLLALYFIADEPRSACSHCKHHSRQHFSCLKIRQLLSFGRLMVACAPRPERPVACPRLKIVPDGTPRVLLLCDTLGSLNIIPSAQLHQAL